MAPALFEDSAPFAPMASLEARSGPPQPQAAAQQLRRRRSLPEGASRGASRRGLAIFEPTGPATLLGVSLGGRVVWACLEVLASLPAAEAGGLVQDVLLLAAPVTINAARDDE